LLDPKILKEVGKMSEDALEEKLKEAPLPDNLIDQRGMQLDVSMNSRLLQLAQFPIAQRLYAQANLSHSYLEMAEAGKTHEPISVAVTWLIVSLITLILGVIIIRVKRSIAKLIVQATSKLHAGEDDLAKAKRVRYWENKAGKLGKILTVGGGVVAAITTAGLGAVAVTSVGGVAAAAVGGGVVGFLAGAAAVYATWVILMAVVWSLGWMMCHVERDRNGCMRSMSRNMFTWIMFPFTVIKKIIDPREWVKSSLLNETNTALLAAPAHSGVGDFRNNVSSRAATGW